MCIICNFRDEVIKLANEMQVGERVGTTSEAIGDAVADFCHDKYRESELPIDMALEELELTGIQYFVFLMALKKRGPEFALQLARQFTEDNREQDRNEKEKLH